ncbi:MAG TPA: hypothetical protein VG317_03675, partial [Pseudonocardiaceae bacterium]|nr:hypothetical protein [Pseudonocardiaceae bacterium]
MVRDGSARLTPDRGDGEPDADTRTFARQWAAELANTSHVALSRAEIEQVLHDVTQELVAMLRAESFSPEPAAAIGARLVADNFTEPRALGRSITLLGAELPALADLPHDEV